MSTTTDPRITIEPGKRGGKPCLRGIRITVEDVLGWSAAGMSEEDILADHPDLKKADFEAFTSSPPQLRAANMAVREIGPNPSRSLTATSLLPQVVLDQSPQCFKLNIQHPPSPYQESMF